MVSFTLGRPWGGSGANSWIVSGAVLGDRMDDFANEFYQGSQGSHRLEQIPYNLQKEAM